MLRNWTISPLIAGRRATPTAIALIALAAVVTGCGDGSRQALEKAGLHVQDLTVGAGDTAASGDFLTVSYGIWQYLDGAKGREIERVGDEGKGFLLGAGEVMPGWDEGLVGMQVNGVRRLLVGPEKIGRSFRPRSAAAEDVLWCEVTLTGLSRVEVTDLEIGTGEPLRAGDYGTIHYTGWHYEDGAKADQFVTSRQDTAPTGVMLGAGLVNRGLELGLEGMRAGGKRQVVVPPELAYGKAGRDEVKPDATLIYEVELVARLEVARETLREGAGDPAGPGDRIRIHLSGWVRREDGTKGEQFKDSRALKMPVVLILGDFKIQPGLELGIRGMKPGELRRLDVPSDMAFGPRGWHRGDRTLVPPDTDVIYEVELLAAGSPSR